MSSEDQGNSRNQPPPRINGWGCPWHPLQVKFMITIRYHYGCAVTRRSFLSLGDGLAVHCIHSSVTLWIFSLLLPGLLAIAWIHCILL